ncbi:MAG: MoxR family ATPase [Bacteroidota bacterium]
MAELYTGKELVEKKEVALQSGEGKPYSKTLHPYLPDDSLIEAVNLAAQLRRPLLLMGDPGCGKSILAEALAYAWHENDFHKYYFEWNIKSHTKAQDGIYTYDPISRLRQTETEEGKSLIAEEKVLKDDKKKLTQYYIEQGYLEEGPLKKAIDSSVSLYEEKEGKNNPPVLLIDEIDKASIDFPNDLLLELDKFSYYIKETAYRSAVQGKEKYPFVVITSNNEKELPPAFLRRCIYHYIAFPKEEKLKMILAKRNAISLDDDLLEATIEAFLLTRKKLSEGLSNKSVSTAELIDWFEGLRNRHLSKLEEDIEDDRKVLGMLKAGISQLSNDKKAKLPLHHAILKNWDALVRILPKEVYDPS